ncbi:MAG: STAS domain-containing protein [Gammaproteobacteria bacterium]|nr:STAS domain-containing protein [Gammaproteobacteria bacterium]
MSEIRVDPGDPAVLNVSGELNFSTVPALLERGSALLAGCEGQVRLDLGGVTRADSAGLALLIEWLRVARRGRARLEIRNMPAQLRAIARVSGLDSILPMGGADEIK